MSWYVKAYSNFSFKIIYLSSPHAYRDYVSCNPTDTSSDTGYLLARPVQIHRTTAFDICISIFTNIVYENYLLKF